MTIKQTLLSVLFIGCATNNYVAAQEGRYDFLKEQNLQNSLILNRCLAIEPKFWSSAEEKACNFLNQKLEETAMAETNERKQMKAAIRTLLSDLDDETKIAEYHKYRAALRSYDKGNESLRVYLDECEAKAKATPKF